MRFFRQTNINFLNKRLIYFILSTILVGVSVAALVVRKGPVLGIDFTGGTFLQIGFNETPAIEKVRSALSEDGWTSFSLQTQPTNNSIIIRVKSGSSSKEDIAGRLLASLNKSFSGNVKSIPERVEFVGPVVGKQLITNTLKAIFGSLLVMIVYVAFRFKKWVWGFAGVLALAHDVFITVGLLTLLNVEITLVVIAALLTLAGYSINDSIVIFDRVRENFRLSRRESPEQTFNRSLNETLARTVNTSLTTLMAALALYFLGGEVIHDFALTLSFGVLIGTYSSIGVAISTVYQLQYGRKKGKH